MTPEQQALKDMYYARMIRAESMLRTLLYTGTVQTDAYTVIKIRSVLDHAEALVKHHVKLYPDSH